MRIQRGSRGEEERGGKIRLTFPSLVNLRAALKRVPVAAKHAVSKASEEEAKQKRLGIIR
jgi:hypothetical protein